MASSLILNTPNSSIKELCSSGSLSSLPSTYILKDSRDTNVMEDVEIPVIDFCKLTEGTPDERSQVVQDLRKACEEWGFFVLVNHGVPYGLMNSLMDAFKGFFDLPAEEKREYADTHPMNPIRYGTSFNPKVDDVKYWRDYVKIITHPEFHCPAKPPGLREVLQEYTAYTRKLGRKLLGGIWESLGLDEKYINGALNLDSLFQNVVCNLYPACPQPELVMGLPPHSDHGLITILYQNDVNPHENSYLINTGDHMEIVSNGKYKSILHRAVVNGKSTRISIVSVVGPSLDMVVAPDPQLVSSQSPAAFRGIKYGEFMEYQQSNKLKEKSVLDMLRL